MDYGLFDDILQEKFPELFSELHSIQGELSVELLKVRISTNFDATQIAKFLNMNLDEYLKFEFGDVSISPEKYRELIFKVQHLKDNLIVTKILPHIFEESILENENNINYWKPSSHFSIRKNSNYSEIVAKNTNYLDIQRGMITNQNNESDFTSKGIRKEKRMFVQSVERSYVYG